MKTAAISRFVVVAAIAVLVVSGGSTAAWAQCPGSPNYVSNFNSDQTCLTRNGSTVFDSTVFDGNALRITAAVANQTGSAWFNTPQPFANGFDTTFTFQLGGGSGADGIAFVIQNAPTTPLNALGFPGNGGALGYGGDDANANPSRGIPASVAFEIDTFQNAGLGGDPDAHHVAVQSCGASPNTSHHVSSCPSAPGVNPQIAEATTPVLTDNHTHTAEIIYSPPPTSCTGDACKNLTVKIDGISLITVAVDLTSLIGSVPAYVGFTGATGASTDNQYIQKWTYTPSTVVSGTTIDPNNPTTLSQSTILNNAPGKQVQFGFDFSSVPNLQLQSGTTPFIGFSGMTPAQYIARVSGTALEGTTCLTAAGLKDANNNALCLLTALTATTTADSTPSGKNLPQSTCSPGEGSDDIICARNILLSQTLDLDPTQSPNLLNNLLTIPAHTAPGLAEFDDFGTCDPDHGFPVGDPLQDKPCPRSIMSGIQDGPAKLGGTPKPAGSSVVFNCCRPEWVAPTTPPPVSRWNTTNSVPVTFNYPTKPASLHAAQALGVLYGAAPQSVSVSSIDTTIPSYPGEQIALAPGTCPTNSDWTQQNPVPFTATGSLGQFNSNGTSTGTASTIVDGNYNLLYAVVDCDEFINLAYPATINFGAAGIGPNEALWNSAPFGVDTMAPTVSTPVLNPPGGFYAVGTPVTASFTCTDPLKNNFASGIASCGPNSGGGLTPVNVTNAPVLTSSLGSFNFTANATDVAGNSASPSSVPYQVVGGADLSIGIIGNLLVKTGQTITYLIGVANAGPSPAFEVVVKDAIPAGTTFVSSGYAIDSCSFGSGPPSCTIVPPTNSCGSTSGSCTIAGSLPIWTKKNPIGILIQLTVRVTASANTTIKNTASVSGATNADPNLKNNTTVTWPTAVTR
jgi:uncharacterized repeat protein (TIGR01451 family)